MSTSDYSIDFNGILSPISGDRLVGDVLCHDVTGLAYILADTAGKGTGRSSGVLRTTASSGQSMHIQGNGEIPAAVVGLNPLAGAWQYAVVNTVGRLVRSATIVGEVVGMIDEFGNAHVDFSGSFLAPGAGFVPSGTGIYHVSGGVMVSPATLIVDADVTSVGAAKITGLLPLANQAAPTGTGLAKVVAGTWAAAASLLVDADVSATAAIAGTKVAPQFGAQNISATGVIAMGNQPASSGTWRTPQISTFIQWEATTGAPGVELARTFIECRNGAVIFGGSPDMADAAKGNTIIHGDRIKIAPANAGTAYNSASTNYLYLAYDGTQNLVTSSLLISDNDIINAGTVALTISPLHVGAAAFTWGRECTSVTYSQATHGSGSGGVTTFRAQNAAAGAFFGGDLNLVAGTGTSGSGNFSATGLIASVIANGSTAASYIQLWGPSIHVLDAAVGEAIRITPLSTGATTMKFSAGVTSGNISWSGTSGAGVGAASLTIAAQDCSTGEAAGGTVIVRGGAKSGALARGGVRLQMNGTTETMIEAACVTNQLRVVSLCFAADLTTTQMPALTGDGVVFLANAATAPTANPVGGSIIYCEAGATKIRGSSGTVTTIALA